MSLVLPPSIPADVGNFACEIQKTHTQTFSFEGLGPQYTELPAFLRKTKYENPTDVMHTVIQDAYKLDEGDEAFDWLQKDTRKLAIFQKFMSIRRQGAKETWLSVHPVEEETKTWNPDKAVFVNIGGNIGMQNAEFKEKYPDVPGRVVLQDRPENIAKAIQTPGVENIAYDFFTPQPIKGTFNSLSRDTVLHHDTSSNSLLVSCLTTQARNTTTSEPFSTTGLMTRLWRY